MYFSPLLHLQFYSKGKIALNLDYVAYIESMTIKLSISFVGFNHPEKTVKIKPQLVTVSLLVCLLMAANPFSTVMLNIAP